MYLFTKMGYTILVSDVDTVWMQNPLPYMANYMEADVLTSSDHLVTSPQAPRPTGHSLLSCESHCAEIVILLRPLRLAPLHTHPVGLMDEGAGQGSTPEISLF